jgi:hypothetical protein
MVEKLLYGGAEAGSCPDVAKATAKLAETAYQDRVIQGTPKRTPDECGRGFGQYVNGLAHWWHFGDRDATVQRI